MHMWLIVFLQVSNYARVIVFLQRVDVFLHVSSYARMIVFAQQVSSYAPYCISASE